MELLTLATSLVAVIGVLIVNSKVDKLAGKIETLETGHHAHVNAPGLHHMTAASRGPSDPGAGALPTSCLTTRTPDRGHASAAHVARRVPVRPQMRTRAGVVFS